jgi:AcrR family transcriptional regulator
LTPPSSKRSKGTPTRVAILDATSELIAERGVDGFTISEIAKRSGINRALIYHYFKDRDNLVVHALDHVISQYEGSAPADNVVDAVETNLRMYLRHPEVARVFYQLLLNKQPLLRLGERIRETVAAIESLRRPGGPEPPYDPAMALLIVLFAQTSWSFSRETFAELLDVSVEEADRRFVNALRWAAQRGFEALTSAYQAPADG